MLLFAAGGGRTLNQTISAPFGIRSVHKILFLQQMQNSGVPPFEVGKIHKLIKRCLR